MRTLCETVFRQRPLTLTLRSAIQYGTSVTYRIVVVSRSSCKIIRKTCARGTRKIANDKGKKTAKYVLPVAAAAHALLPCHLQSCEVVCAAVLLYS